MIIRVSDQAIAALRDAPTNVRRAFEKQLRFVAADLRDPWLHAKKYDESRDLRQARLNRDRRFYFNIVGDTYVIRNRRSRTHRCYHRLLWQSWVF